MAELVATPLPAVTRGSCRCGNPLLSADLAKVSCAEARSIIVLATAGAPQQSDARVLRITLSLLGLNDRLHNEGLPGLQVLWALLSTWRCMLGQHGPWIPALKGQN